MNRHNAGTVLAVIGVLILIATLGFHYWRPAIYDIEPWGVVIGAIIGFVGFDMRNPKEAKAGAAVLIDGGVRIITAIRGGSRAEDKSRIATLVMPASSSPAPREHEWADGQHDEGLL